MQPPIETIIETIEIQAPIYCSRELADWVVDPQRFLREVGLVIVDPHYRAPLARPNHG